MQTRCHFVNGYYNQSSECIHNRIDQAFVLHSLLCLFVCFFVVVFLLYFLFVSVAFYIFHLHFLYSPKHSPYG